MKVILTVAIALTIFSCKDSSNKHLQGEAKHSVEEVVVKYPKELERTFQAHGGIEKWRNYKTLSFNLPKDEGVETHTIDLLSRKDKIVSSDYVMGFDGKEVWLLDETESYKGDPGFYHNLMFYFYAMPFVFADDGILLESTDELIYEGVSYPGIKVSYNEGVGASAKDNYYIHYDPITFEMRWLGYTVTYKSNEVSDNVRWIRYNDWQYVNEMLLPKSISWYTYEGRTILEPKSKVNFEDVRLELAQKNKEFYSKSTAVFKK